MEVLEEEDALLRSPLQLPESRHRGTLDASAMAMRKSLTDWSGGMEELDWPAAI